MIIDTHVHMGKCIDFDLPEESIIYSMKKYGIDYSLVSNIEATEFDHQQKPLPEKFQRSQVECLKKALRFARKYPKMIGIAAWVKVANELPDDEFIKLIKDNRDIIFGIKVHPFHSKTEFDSAKLEPYIELAKEFKLPIITHTDNNNEALPIRVYNAAKKYPDVNFVMVHMGLGSDNSEAIKLISMLPNLYGDTTWVPIKSTINFINLCGSHKIFFGSDSPIDGKDTYLRFKNGNRSVYQEYFNELRSLISKEDYDNLMYKNAIRFFKLPVNESRY